MKIAIVGAAGRMGKKLVELANGTELEVVSKIDIAEGYDRTWAPGTEGVVDFSHHTAVAEGVAKAAAEGIAYVIGTTGLSADEQRAVDLAAKQIPIVQSIREDGDNGEPAALSSRPDGLAFIALAEKLVKAVDLP